MQENDHINNAVESLENSDAIGFKKLINDELSVRLYKRISLLKKEMQNQNEDAATEDADVTEAQTFAPSAAGGAKTGGGANSGAGQVLDPLDDDVMGEIESAFGLGDEVDEEEVVAKDEDLSLDPNFEKEYFFKEMNYKGHKITIKQLGLGLSKPVRAYVNGKRWELFPGPDVAMKTTKTYVDEMISNEAKTNAEQTENDSDDTITEKVEIDGRTSIYKKTVGRLESFRKMRAEKLKKLGETANTKNKWSGLYDDGSGKGAVIPEAAMVETDDLDHAISMSEDGKYEIDEEELSPKQKKYRAFFQKTLKQFKAKSPADLKGDKKKEFFNYVKKNYKG